MTSIAKPPRYMPHFRRVEPRGARPHVSGKRRRYLEASVQRARHGVLEVAEHDVRTPPEGNLSIVPTTSVVTPVTLTSVNA
ncbi:MAG: hypothetical protein ABIT38_20510 [Gemmatimonadaceae bacterium]